MMMDIINELKLYKRDSHLWQRKNHKEIKEKASLGLQVPESDGAGTGVPEPRRPGGEGPLSHLELQPHVPQVQRVGHAAENGDGDGEPTVYEEAHARVAYREGVKEERV